ncbi:MAG TPA: hypothetical protein VK030_01695 [Actinomycetales bacterium]|nr:hypothetical protein [Actinomycetales bacterium]
MRDDYLFAYYTTHEDNRIDRYALEGPPGSLMLEKREARVRKERDIAKEAAKAAVRMQR